MIAVEERFARSQRTRTLWQTSGFRDRMLQVRNTPEAKTRNSLAQTGIRAEALPFLLRGGSNEEVAQITKRPLPKIKNLRFRLTAAGELPRPTEEESWQTRSKAQRGKPRDSHGRIYSLEQKNSFVFARRLRETEFITEEMSSWNEIQAFYEETGELPIGDFADRIILEAFFIATKRLILNRDTEMLRKYVRLGREVDRDWFNKNLVREQRLINDAIYRKYARSSGKSPVTIFETPKEKKLTESLPVPLDDYTPDVQELVLLVDNTNIPLTRKRVYLSYLRHALTGQDLAHTANALHLPVQGVEQHMSFATGSFTDQDWDTLEGLIEQAKKSGYRRTYLALRSSSGS